MMDGLEEPMTMNRRSRMIAAAAACLVALALASPARAQVFAGRIDVTIEDASSGPLPGVSVELSVPSDQRLLSDAQHQRHFLNPPASVFTVRLSPVALTSH